jgi:hypothetical protein
MKRFGVLHPLWMSFYSPALYRDVAQHWTGTGFLYLLMLLALSWIHPIVQLHHRVAGMIETLGPAVLAQVPTITIHQGEVSIQEPQPYVIAVPGSATPLMIVDTTGQTTPESTDAFLLLTKHQAVVRKSPRETRTYDLAGIQDVTIDRSSAGAILGACRRYLAVLSYPAALLGSYVYRILQVLLYASIGMSFASLLKVSLEYPDLLRLSSIAVTPAIVADTVRGALHFQSSFAWWTFCFVLSMGYLLFAVRANSGAEPEVSAGSAGITGAGAS